MVALKLLLIDYRSCQLPEHVVDLQAHLSRFTESIPECGRWIERVRIVAEQSRCRRYIPGVISSILALLCQSPRTANLDCWEACRWVCELDCVHSWIETGLRECSLPIDAYCNLVRKLVDTDLNRLSDMGKVREGGFRLDQPSRTASCLELCDVFTWD